MSADDRIDRLERRMEVLEALIRQLGDAPSGAPSGAGSGAPSGAGSVGGVRPVEHPVSAALEPAPSNVSAPEPDVREPRIRPPRVRSKALIDSEQWIGQRGLLAVGVIALILAAGYLLKLSFERGWISPLLRCVGGAAAGTVVGAIGWRLQGRYRTYGAALIGCGAAIIYLSVWAATRLYGVLPPTSGIVALAMVSIALAMIAYGINVEALGTTAALGAFMAPVLLGRDQANPDLLLLYLASMSVGLGLVAARRRWRLTALVVAASFFLVGGAGASDRASPWGVLLYGVIGGSAALALALSEGWWETRVLAFSGGWFFLSQASERLPLRWPVLAAALVLAAPVWWHALRRPLTTLWPPIPGEGIYFLVTPILLGWAVHEMSPSRFDLMPGLVALIVAVPYLVMGYARPRPPFALVGAAALGIAAGERWRGSLRVAGWLPLALLWAALDHPLRRFDGRWYGLATLAAALAYLFGDAQSMRTSADPAFFGRWALALWFAIGVTAVFAAGLWRERDAALDQPVRAGLWLTTGAMALFGVTAELRRYFALKPWSVERVALTSGLMVSAWWLIFAAVLVGIGFRRKLRPARLAGLAVAGLAIVKVVLFDLSSLDALYRVGSVFILGLVSLSLAYLYHRQALHPGPSESGL